MPNFDPAWLLLIFPAAMIAAAILQSRQYKKGRRDQFGAPYESPSQQDNPDSPSSDFAALIQAIKAEGSAYRREEVREDRGKTVRDWITILLIGATLYAVWRQVEEMAKVYGPIKNQADAAMQQAVNSEKALIQAQRAWVGPRVASFAAEPTVGKPLEVSIGYDNSGHEPGVGFRYFSDPFVMSLSDQAEGNKRIQDYMNVCRNTTSWSGGSVVYPSNGGFGAPYSFFLRTDDSFVTDGVVKGKEIVVIQGCFVYRTFDLPKHSFFCYFYKQGMSKITNLNICDSGHDAN